MMRRRTLLTALAYGLTVSTLAALVYYFVLRPRCLRWGATDEEIGRDLPGDELLPAPMSQITRGITINISPADVWPWLVQMGQGRGGFYSYDWLENLFGLDIHNADTIVSEWQQPAVGDIVRMHPDGGSMVAAVEPCRALVLYTNPRTQMGQAVALPDTLSDDYLAFMSTWSFYLEPCDEHTTRLIVRSRGAWHRNVGSILMWSVLMEPLHFIMERKMLLGIKARAEAMVEQSTERARNRPSPRTITSAA